jgi:hypothetical protein
LALKCINKRERGEGKEIEICFQPFSARSSPLGVTQLPALLIHSEIKASKIKVNISRLYEFILMGERERESERGPREHEDEVALGRHKEFEF